MKLNLRSARSLTAPSILGIVTCVQADKILRIDGEFDYVEFQPPGAGKKGGGKAPKLS
jgi:hypothetical protein